MKWALKDSAHIISDGLGMLVEQAALSFEFWLGKKPSTKAVINLIRERVDL
jgi:shikimate dehydrogenase